MGAVSADDSGIGLWVDGGVFRWLGNRLKPEPEARISRAELSRSLLGASFAIEAGGEHFGLTTGWGWWKAAATANNGGSAAFAAAAGAIFVAHAN